jgi:hypothetical protein
MYTPALRRMTRRRRHFWAQWNTLERFWEF